ncbi:MAG: transposase [Dehalococcoidia bacterium]|nr:transposase [Dehalococcoidia bacterium]
MDRPRLPLGDVVFALGVKTYSMLSGRRATSFIRDAASLGLLDAVPSYNTAFRYLEKPELTDVLKMLIEESAKPLAVIESNFAIDSTGIGTTTYRRWFDHKWGRERSTQTWVKVHAMTGTTTNIVTAIAATATESADTVQLPALLARTAESFDIREVSADRAYSSKSNLHAITDVGAMPYIPFKQGSTGEQTHHKFDGLWSRMWFYYQFKREQFLTHYHRRSNAETTFHMVKSKFGGSVRAKTPTAQVNEALLKFLCHNVVVLIQSIYELGIEPEFWSDEDCLKSQSLPQKSCG